MNCAACRHENPPHAKFCLECGAALATRCARCATELPPGAKFCLECGAPVGAAAPAQPAAPLAPERSPRAYTPKHLADKILASRAALEGERKQVTVLFADVRGSMELAEQVDAEQWHAILDRFFAILTDGVHRFEGTVNQYTGDGIMALFGAPLAHEDHAQRACYAALHLRDALREFARELKRERGLDFATRIGINSGEVVVGKIGDDLRMDYTAQGHTVGLAQRMESLAEAGRIYLSAATAQHAQDYFALEDLGEFRVKGASEPMRVHELLGLGALRTRFEVSRQRGLSRFVGRLAEIAALDATLDRAIAGQGSALGVVADAGTGKSRLCFEFLERCRVRGVPTVSVSALSHTKAIPYVTTLECFRRRFGIEDRDSARVARDKIAGRLLLTDEALREELPVVFDFLGCADPARPSPPIEGDARRRRLLEVQRRLVRATGEPEVWLIEDLHWLDDASEAFVADWAEAVRDSRCVLLLNYRPQYRAAWLRRAHELPLAALGKDATRELIAALLGADPSLAELTASIEARVGGNPFFAEEFVRSLAESGRLAGASGSYRLAAPIESIAVPASVEAVLAARIDRLAEREKQVLQAAAVIGREFSRPVLERALGLGGEALDAALAALRESELIFEESLYPVERFAFKHALVQDVAGAALLSERRRQLHAAVARALEAGTESKPSEIAALVASHFEAAGEPLLAAEHYAVAARELALHGMAQALSLWRKVRDLADASPEGAAADRLRIESRASIVNGWMATPPAAEVDEAYAVGRALCEHTQDTRALAHLLAGYGYVVRHRGDPMASNVLLREAIQLARSSGDMIGLARASTVLATTLWNQGPLEEALQLIESTLTLSAAHPEVAGSRELLSVGSLAWSRVVRGLILAESGDFTRGDAVMVEALHGAADAGDAQSLFWVHYGWTVVHRLAGRLERIEGHVRELARVQSDRPGDLLNELGQARAIGMFAAGRFGDLLELARTSTALQRSPDVVLALVASGRADEAIAHAQREGSSLRTQGYRVREIRLLLAHSQALRAVPGPARESEIIETLAAAEDAIRATGARAYAPQLLEERARLSALLGNRDAAERMLRDAHARYAEIGASGHAARLERELAS